jgi:RHS repeat-associated protein
VIGKERSGDDGKVSKGWMGLENDYENKYMQLGYRTYNPNIGSFLQLDSLFEKFPDATPYHYCYNSPMIGKEIAILSSTVHFSWHKSI